MPEKEKNGGEQGAMVSGVPGFSGDYSALIVGTNLAVLLVPALWVFPFKKRIPDAILKAEHVMERAGLADCTGPMDCTDWRNVPDGKERHYGCDWRNHGAPSASDCAGGGQRAGDSH